MADLRDRPTAVRAGEELDFAKLEPFLLSHFPDSAGPLSVEQYAGGHSNLTYLVRLGGREVVLRRPPFGSKVKSAHDMGREFRVLSKLHSVYKPAPEVRFYCDDESVLGAPFYVMEPIHGVILRKKVPSVLAFSTEKARRLSESFVDNLVRLHRVDYAAAGLAELGRAEGYLERQVRGWTERYHGSKTHEYVEVEKICAWMQGHIPSTNNVSLIHNDYKYDNVVLDANDITKIVGVLDWEMCTIGDSLADLGTTLAYWIDTTDPEEMQQLRWGPTTHPGSFSRSEVAHFYSQKTGRDVSDIAFYVVLARFKLAVIVQQIYYRYSQSLTKDDRFAAMPERIKMILRACWLTAETGHI